MKLTTVPELRLTCHPDGKTESTKSTSKTARVVCTSLVLWSKRYFVNTDGHDEERPANPGLINGVRADFHPSKWPMERHQRIWTRGLNCIHSKCLDYFDEAGADPPAPSTPEAHLQQGNKMYQVAAFTTKKFYLKGITLYTDEFPSKARTFSRSVMTMSSSSTPDSKNSDNFNTAPVTPSDPLPHSNLSTEANPILFGKLNGCQEVRLRLKQSEVVVGPKVDIEVNLGSLTMFLSARQLHVLLELLHGLATPDLEDTSNVTPRARCMEKPMDSSDFHRVEQELLHQLQPSTVIRTKGLQNTQGWSTASLDDSDEEFLPMKGGVMIDSMLSSVASMDGSVLSSGSSVSTSAHSGLAGSFSPTQQHTRNKSHKGAGVRTLDTDPNAEVSHFHVRLSSVVLVLLHEDILTLCVESDGSSLARSSVQQMKSVAQHFFSEIGLFAVSGYDNKDFIEGKKVFERACQLNHISIAISSRTLRPVRSVNAAYWGQILLMVRLERVKSFSRQGVFAMFVD
uniref:Autophagy-related protein 2 n=1 Tax=Timema monikensis TaxID=170555 RepID=A0A7R9EIS5_9NEOP|nr:unnamed protein product [Timema monikensis]